MTATTATPKLAPAALATVVRATNAVWAEHCAQVEAYRAACREDYRAGYSPSHCIHGTYLHTDYDPMCGACEDGFRTAYATKQEFREQMLNEYRAAARELDRRMTIALPVVGELTESRNSTTWAGLIDWVNQPMEFFAKFRD